MINNASIRGIAAALMLTASYVYGDETTSPFHFSHMGRTVAISDVHGAYEAMAAILRQSAVVDNELSWAGGETHLVIVGDLLDRGPESRKAMDLVKALEPQALAAGGRVHLVLGNHEVMNLIGDLRYVSAAEYAAFAEDESDVRRAQAWTDYARYYDLSADDVASQEKFAEQFPHGYFGLRDAFSLRGKYGPWLLEKPVVLTVNDTAFMHGGLSESAARTTFDNLNHMAREQVTEYLTELDKLIAADVLPFTSSFYERSGMLEKFEAEVAAGTRQWTEDTAASAAKLRELDGAFVHSRQSPLWYRGNVGCSALIESGRLDRALEAAGVKRLVVGHTPTPGRRIQSRWEGDLFEIDTGMLNAYYKGRASALVLEEGSESVIYQSEAEPAKAQVQARRVGLRSVDMSVEDLTWLLQSGKVVSRTEDEMGQIRVTLKHDGQEIQAAVMPLSRRKVHFPEVAAYRLDRMLGLEMVPVTVTREYEGKTRELQYLPPRTMDEGQRSQRGLGGSSTCPLQDQIDTFYVFDSLIFNAPRAAPQILYSTDNWQLILVGHQMAFDTKRGRPAHLKSVELDITPAWRQRLTALDEASLYRELEGLLSEKRIKALLKRRDQLLKG